MRAIGKRRIAFLTVAVCLGIAAPAAADAISDFEKARDSFDRGSYAEAADRFRAMLDPTTGSAVDDPVLRERARSYYVACLLGLGKNEEAEREIEAILRANPGASPDPVVFPTAVLDRFADVRARIRAELEAKQAEKLRREQEVREKERREQEAERKRLADLERLARQETHLEHHSRWIAAIPFGVGQFQNGQTAGGWLFLTSETALLATTVTTAYLSQSWHAQGFNAGVDREALNSRLDTVKTVNNIAFAALGVLVAGGIAHAQLTYVPSVPSIRERPLPKSLTVAPTGAALPSGGWIGLQATF